MASTARAGLIGREGTSPPRARALLAGRRDGPKVPSRREHGMARPIWSGSISFGLVNVPVKLLTAVRHQEVRFNLLHKKDGARIKVKRFCAAEDVEVPYEE